jgi:NAD(P)-dependent dehydrogenase (short-subunit alcohol dehydrogenase family)
MVVGRNLERGEKTIAEIRAAGGKADFIPSDLRDAASARAVARKAVELGNGHVDILINNAGAFPFGPTHETSEELFDDVYALNVKAPYFLVAELAPLMARSEVPRCFSNTIRQKPTPGGNIWHGCSKLAFKYLASRLWSH